MDLGLWSNILATFFIFFMRIGIIAEKTGVTRDTIRLYEKMGLLPEVTRPHEYNNYKEYSEKSVDRILFIKTMKKLGLTLKECKVVIEKMVEDSFNHDYQNSFIKEKLKEIDRKVEELKDLKRKLSTYIDGCESVEVIEKIK
jgi:DNA-binding transcriptional MerR regulator